MDNNHHFGRVQSRLLEPGFSWCLQELCGQWHMNVLDICSGLGWGWGGGDVTIEWGLQEETARDEVPAGHGSPKKSFQV